MSWICDNCSYENEDEITHSCFCACCGIAPSSQKIQMVKKEAEALRKQKEKAARGEKKRLKKAKRAKRLDGFEKSIPGLLKGYKVAVVIMFIISSAWIAFTYHFGDYSFAQWENQMSSNMFEWKIQKQLDEKLDKYASAFETLKGVVTANSVLLDKNGKNQNFNENIKSITLFEKESVITFNDNNDFLKSEIEYKVENMKNNIPIFKDNCKNNISDFIGVFGDD